jgi:hypothetical protein
MPNRVATTVAIAALAICATAASASARPEQPNGDDSAPTRLTRAEAAARPALHPTTTSPRKRDTRPTSVVYLGPH